MRYVVSRLDERATAVDTERIIAQWKHVEKGDGTQLIPYGLVTAKGMSAFFCLRGASSRLTNRMLFSNLVSRGSLN